MLIDNIYLVRTKNNKKLYENPLLLQKLYSLLKFFYSDNINISLLDFNLIQSNFDFNINSLIIIETLYLSIDEVKKFINNYVDSSSHQLFLIGETNIIEEKKQINNFLNIDTIKTYITSKLNELDIFEELKQVLPYSPFSFQERNYYKFLYEEKFINGFKKNGIQIFLDGISRGCKNNCTYCILNNIDYYLSRKSNINYNVIYTIKKLFNILKEDTYIQFADENFLEGENLYEHFEKINFLIQELRKFGFTGKIGIDTRLDTIYNVNDSIELKRKRKETIINLANVGLSYVYLGVESFSKSQLERYNKQLNISIYSNSTKLLEESNINYTTGLILWDPMMSLNELKENLAFISKNNLFGKVASLFKELRISKKSQYFLKFGGYFAKERSFLQSQIGFLNSEEINYVDTSIDKIINLIRPIHKIFANSGYRHSDVALFEPLYTSTTPIILKEIPTMISKMEYEILEYIIDNIESIDNNFLISICENCIAYILENLYEIKNMKQNIKILNYYLSVFKEINSNLQYYTTLS